MKNIILETKRLILRPFCKKDLSYFKKLLKDPDVMRFSINGPYKDDLKIEKFLNTILENQKKYGFGSMAILLKKTKKYIGFFGVFKKYEKIRDFGYRLFKKFCEKGYATEAVKVCIDYLKKTFRMKKSIVI